ncbi:hypothetical protein ACFQ9X_48940 [Catenulispora yoronensis]
MSGELEPTARAELRASHEDRDIVVDQLRVAAGTAGSTPTNWTSASRTR